MLILLLLIIPGLLFYFFKGRQNYWKDKPVPSIDSDFYYGNTKGLLKTEHWAIHINRIYKEGQKRNFPLFGFNIYFNPAILVNDLDLIKNIMIKDFSTFHDRPVFSNPKVDPITGHLFVLRGDEWRNLRQKLTPTFTSGKMKLMSETMFKVGIELQQFLSENVSAGGTVLEMKDILARFTTNIIGSTAFGIEIDSLKEPDSEFRVMGKKIFNVPLTIQIRVLLANAFKGFWKKLGFSVFPKDVAAFFIGLVRNMIEYREKNNVRRNDFLDILMELRKSDDMTVEEMAAQCFVFFAGGFETSSTTMMFALYELAKNPDVQEKLRQHLKDHVEKANGIVNYETIIGMDYLGQVVDETLRMYPPLVILFRDTEDDYKVPDTDYTISKGSQVMIPIHAIQHDEAFYPDPERFDPDRFTKEEVQKRHPCAYLPFGTGPRNCIGNRFGLLQSQVGLYAIISKFEVTVCEKTEIPVKFKPTPAPLLHVHGMWLKLKPLQ